MTAYVTDPTFNDLYFDFTGYRHDDFPKDRRAVAQDLASAIAGEATDLSKGTLVVATAVGIYAYDSGHGHRLLGGATFRAAPNSGFYEITSLAHVGPAIAYLATLKELGVDGWQGHLDPLIAHLRAVREVNAGSEPNHWLTRLGCEAWAGRERTIQRMMDYGCALAGHYLAGVRDDPDILSSDHVASHFLERSTEEYPIGFNTVMIATFSLEALKSAHEIYTCLHPLGIEWDKAQVLLHNVAGANYSAGLTADSNWLHPLLVAIAGPSFDPERIIIAPYAPIPDSVGTESLPDEDFERLSSSTWGALFVRPLVVQRAFAFVEDIRVSRRTPIPGDYGYTRADQIDHFIRRLKFSTETLKEMLSNTVGFWIGGEAAAKGWDFAKMDIPGLTHGFPDGLDGYPSAAGPAED